MKLFTILCTSFVTFAACSDKVTILDKPRSIKLTMICPLTGSTIPMQGICTSSAEFFLNSFNQQTKYLKDYNLIVDIVDDQCSHKTAVEKLVPSFSNWKPTYDISEVGKHGIGLPKNATFSQKEAEVLINIPLMAGPICSGPCKVLGSFIQHFNMIGVSHFEFF